MRYRYADPTSACLARRREIRHDQHWRGYSNRAKVVTESQPPIARLLAIQGTFKRVPFNSTEDISSTEDSRKIKESHHTKMPWIAGKRALGGCDSVTTLARLSHSVVRYHTIPHIYLLRHLVLRSQFPGQVLFWVLAGSRILCNCPCF